jgi:cytochrome c-type biogenesis protein
MLGYGLAFVAGFSIVFIALGASATALGQLLRAYRFEANLLAGGLVALFGLHMAGALRLGWLMREWRVPAMPSGGGPPGPSPPT